jgi:hypothetical protein
LFPWKKAHAFSLISHGPCQDIRAARCLPNSPRSLRVWSFPRSVLLDRISNATVILTIFYRIKRSLLLPLVVVQASRAQPSYLTLLLGRHPRRSPRRHTRLRLLPDGRNWWPSWIQLDFHLRGSNYRCNCVYLALVCARLPGQGSLPQCTSSLVCVVHPAVSPPYADRPAFIRRFYRRKNVLALFTASRSTPVSRPSQSSPGIES